MAPSSSTALRQEAAPYWRRSLAWLLFLGPFFFLSYAYSNHHAAQKLVNASWYFDWERYIPFLPWTILPYWSIDLFYGLSFLLCRSRQEVDRHALRLLTAQIVSVSCFLLFPLHFAFERPHVDGFFGTLFDVLMGFDLPYNQAPSLHIGLLVILWARFAGGVSTRWLPVVHAWAALIGISVLTTYQHHFIDVPTGAAVGLLCLWLFPDQGPLPLTALRRAPSTRRIRIAVIYFIGALALAVAAIWLGGAALWLMWGTLALALVALIYGGVGAEAGFQKYEGRHSLAASLLLAPYTVGAWINSRAWTNRHPKQIAIVDGVSLGRLPRAQDLLHDGIQRFSALCDLCPELPAPDGNWNYAGFPWLDLVSPTPAQLTEAASTIETLRGSGQVLVCCALGYSRSACAVLAWLLITRRAESLEAAEAIVRAKRPMIVLSPAHRAALEQLRPQNAEGLQTHGGSHA